LHLIHRPHAMKFGICGIGQDLNDIVEDHASVERLLEEGAIHVQLMPTEEIDEIFYRAEDLFAGSIKFEREAVARISELSQGYPYLAQLIGKECVNQVNRLGIQTIDNSILQRVLDDIKSGRAFPT
jgi:hypothetical protein